MYSFSYLEPVCCSMSHSNCCFLTCTQVSQEAGQLVWYSHLFQNFPQFIVIHIVKGFGIVSNVEIDVFLELSCFFNDPTDVGNLTSGSSAFAKSSLNIWKFTVHLLLKPGYVLLIWGEGIIEEVNIKNDTKWPSLGSCINGFKRARDVENRLVDTRGGRRG